MPGSSPTVHDPKTPRSAQGAPTTTNLDAMSRTDSYFDVQDYADDTHDDSTLSCGSNSAVKYHEDDDSPAGLVEVQLPISGLPNHYLTAPRSQSSPQLSRSYTMISAATSNPPRTCRRSKSMQSLKRAGDRIVRTLSTHDTKPTDCTVPTPDSTSEHSEHSDSASSDSALKNESEYTTTCEGQESQLTKEQTSTSVDLDPFQESPSKLDELLPRQDGPERGVATNLVKLWKRAKSALFDSSTDVYPSLSPNVKALHLQPSRLLGLKSHLDRVREAAENGDLGSMISLGRAYLYGHLGVSVDRKSKAEGLLWLTKAAELSSQLYPQGPYELAKAYEQLPSVRERDRARELYNYAATKYHFAPAAARLGLAYATSDTKLGCAYDPTLSIHFYTIAAYSGDPESMMALCDWHLACVSSMVGNGPDKLKTARRNQKLAFEWANNAARHGLPRGMHMLGHCYTHGVGVNKSHKRGLLWYQAAARAGYLFSFEDPKAIKCYS